MKHIEEFNEAKKYTKKERETILMNLIEDSLVEYTDLVVEKGNFYVQPSCYPINISWKGEHSTNSEYPLVFEENLKNAENDVKYIKAIKSMMVRIKKTGYKIDHLYFHSRNYGQQMQLSVKPFIWPWVYGYALCAKAFTIKRRLAAFLRAFSLPLTSEYRHLAWSILCGLLV